MKLPTGMQVFERGWLSSNNILCVDDTHAGLIDSGYCSHAPQTLALLQHSLGNRSLDDLINTHLHSDHCGGNALLQATYPNLRTSIPYLLEEQVQDWQLSAAHYASVGQKCPQFTFQAILKPNDIFRTGPLTWQALAAPGHDPTSLIFYCAQERILVSADALWENGFGVIFPELEGESGFQETHDTLRLIAGLDVRMVIPGHGRPFDDVEGALERAQQRLRFLSSEPIRNAQNALRVLVKFKLLEDQRISFAALCHWLNESRLLTHLKAQLQDLLGPVSTEQLAEYALSGLLKAGVARRENDEIFNQD